MDITVAEAVMEIRDALKTGLPLTIRVVTGGVGRDIRFVKDDQLGINTWYFLEIDELGNYEIAFHPDDICLLGPFFFTDIKPFDLNQATTEICDLLTNDGTLEVRTHGAIRFDNTDWQLVKDNRLPRAISYVRERDDTGKVIKIISFKYDMDVIIQHVAKKMKKRKSTGKIIID